MSTVGVVGLGVVGEALLGMLLDAGHEVIGVDSDVSVLARVRKRLPAAESALTTETAALRRASLVIEAVPEDERAKRTALSATAAVCPEGTVLVTTGSAVPLHRLATAVGRPADTVGLRFLAPPAPGGFVERTRTTLTAAPSVEALDAVLSAIGLSRTSVTHQAADDATAVVYGYLNRAVRLHERDRVHRADIDTAMRLGCGLPLGPFQLLDRIGLDSAAAVLDDLAARTGDASFAPAPLLGTMIARDRLGRKTGRGFYTYDESGAPLDTAPARPAAARPPAGGTAAVRRIGVVGSGVMARGIAETTAAAGFRTALVARSDAKADEALAAVAGSLTRSVRRGRIHARTKAATLEALSVTGDFSALGDCDLVIEAVAEDLAVKRELFARLGAVCAPHAVLATTTSSLPVAVCAEASGVAARVIGTHFFNPAPLMQLVEVARADTTDDATVRIAEAVCARLGKTTVRCADRTGFLVNYLLFPYLGHAMRLLDRPGASADEIDTAVREGFGHPLGPFALLDAIGLDVSLAIQRRLYADFGDPAQEPPAILEQLVSSGWLGRKNGRGFVTAVR
ncbi:3-hydroxyacyl-CoA dehydrogenase family protein [Streptomyces sp. NPDC003032]